MTPPASSSVPSRAGLALAAVLAAVVAVFLGKALFPGAALYRDVLTPPVLLRLGCLAKMFFLVIAVVFAWRNVAAFARGNPSRLAWKLLAGGFLAFLLGQTSFAYYQVLRGMSSPGPSVGDAFFLLGYALTAAALVSFVRAYAASGFPVGESQERWILGLGTGVAALAVVYPILRPVLLTPGPALDKLLNLAYPLLDIALLIPTVLLLRISLRFRGGRVSRIWLMLLSGFLFGCAGDVLFAYFSSLEQTYLEDVMDAMYLLSFGFMALGALYQRELLES